ncbi:hypothetical protein CPZ25_018155 [Eubacterium maltosivorans]|uniref:Uncharacterized protein n=1 Tax=Eubacterium maltosivorans TaxID=2041044 RepID=A0A4P9CDX0_EUBML|nr:hypothetical protein CPZ25_018155 [Eubacterium maltosivorans]
MRPAAAVPVVFASAKTFHNYPLSTINYQFSTQTASSFFFASLDRFYQHTIAVYAKTAYTAFDAERVFKISGKNGGKTFKSPVFTGNHDKKA